jgi:hypothetical protein
MNRSAIVFMIGIFAIGTAAAQSAKDLTPPPRTPATTAQVPRANGSLANGSAIDAALNKSLDSKKAKKDEPVSARITEDVKNENGSTVIPRGSKLEGHVTQASSREKGDSYSTLGILFDKAVLKNGEEIPLSVQVQAIAISQDAATAPAAGMSPAAMGGGESQAAGLGRNPSSSGMEPRGGMEPGTSPVAAYNTNAVANTDTNNAMAGKGAVGGLNPSGRLKPGSRGVFGLQGIGLATAAEGTQTVAVVTSTDKNVHLDGGTQLLLVTLGPKS